MPHRELVALPEGSGIVEAQALAAGKLGQVLASESALPPGPESARPPESRYAQTAVQPNAAHNVGKHSSTAALQRHIAGRSK